MLACFPMKLVVEVETRLIIFPGKGSILLQPLGQPQILSQIISGNAGSEQNTVYGYEEGSMQRGSRVGGLFGF